MVLWDTPPTRVMIRNQCSIFKEGSSSGCSFWGKMVTDYSENPTQHCMTSDTPSDTPRPHIFPALSKVPDADPEKLVADEKPTESDESKEKAEGEAQEVKKGNMGFMRQKCRGMNPYVVAGLELLKPFAT